MTSSAPALNIPLSRAGERQDAPRTHFTDLSFRSKTAASSLPYVGWGTAFLDYDNDGLLDVIVGNRHVYAQMDLARLGASAGYRQRRLLYHNHGDGTFEEVGAQFGGDPAATQRSALAVRVEAGHTSSLASRVPSRMR